MNYIEFLEERFLNVYNQYLEQERKISSLAIKLLSNVFGDDAKFNEIDAILCKEMEKFAALSEELKKVNVELKVARELFEQPKPDFSLN